MASERAIVYSVWFHDWEESELMGLYARAEDAQEHVRRAMRKGAYLQIQRHEVLDSFPGLQRAERYADDGGKPKGWLSEAVEGPPIPLSRQPRPTLVGSAASDDLSRPEPRC